MDLYQVTMCLHMANSLLVILTRTTRDFLMLDGCLLILGHKANQVDRNPMLAPF